MTALAEVVDRIVPADTARIVAMFEHCLERAKAGEIVAAIVVVEQTGREIAHAYETDVGDHYRLLGALESAKRRLMEAKDL